MNETISPRALLQEMFATAIEAVQPNRCIPDHLPAKPKGKLIVIGAGKASAAMARAWSNSNGKASLAAWW